MSEGNFKYNKIFKFANKMYPLLKLEGIWLIFSIIPIVLLTLVQQDFSNVFLYVLITCLFGPSLFSLLRVSKNIDDDENVKIVQIFITNMKKYIKETLIVWIPYVFIMGILSIDLLYFKNSNQPLAAVLNFIVLFISIILTLFTLNLMVIYTFFNFKYKDALKLAVYYLLIKFDITLKNILVLIILIGSMFFLSNFLVFFLISFTFFLIYINSKEMLQNIKANYVD